MSLDAQSIRMRGNADSYESIDSIKQELLSTGYFSNIDARGTKSKKEGVDFRLNMTLDQLGDEAEGELQREP